MPKVNLVWYQPKVRRIMKDVRALKLKEISSIKGTTVQAVSQSFLSGKIEKDITVWIQIFDKAGWELKEKEENE